MRIPSARPSRKSGPRSAAALTASAVRSSRRILRGAAQYAERFGDLVAHDGGEQPAAPAVACGGVAFGVFYLEMSGAMAEVIGKKLRDGYLVFGRFGQRDANRVADAVGQQRADADGTLDAAFQTVAGFGYSQMDRIGHRFTVHRFAEEPVGGDHDAGVARLHRDDDLIERFLAADAQKLHCGGDHSFGRVAPPVEDTFGERSVIHADAQRDAALAAAGDERLQFAVIGAVVARIDADLIDVLRGDGRRFGQEVDVGDDGRRESVGTQPRYDISEIFGLPCALGREPHDGCSGTGDTLDLGDAGGRVERVGVGHRLDGDGSVAADGTAADADFVCPTAAVLRKIDHL